MGENIPTLASLKGLPINKNQQLSFVNGLKSELLSGEIDIIDAFIFLKTVSDSFSLVIKDEDVGRCFMDEVEKYKGDERINNDNFKIEISSKKTYDYSGDAEITELKNKIKERENYLKALPESGGVDINTGHVIYRPPFKSSEFSKITLKK